MRNPMFRIVLVAGCVLFAFSALPTTLAAHEPEKADSHGSQGGCGHAHSAPHGGTLIPLGDHVAHVELLLDSKDGKVRLYVLGAHAEKSIRITSPTLAIDLHSIGGQEIEGETLELKAVASLLTGEKVGDTSEFAVSHPALVGAHEFSGRLRAITLRGVVFEDIAVSCATETAHHDHDHHHEHGHDHTHSDHHHDH
jgi:hypothetical protein